MPNFTIFYDDEILEHLKAHGVTIEEFEQVVSRPSRLESSNASDDTIAMGYTAGHRYLACVYEVIDEFTIRAVTAYEV